MKSLKFPSLIGKFKNHSPSLSLFRVLSFRIPNFKTEGVDGRIWVSSSSSASLTFLSRGSARVELLRNDQSSLGQWELGSMD